MADDIIDPRIKTPDYKPAWQVGANLNLGATQRQEADEKAVRDAEWGVGNMADSFQRGLRSGDNFAVQVAKQLNRAIESGPRDPDWKNNQDEWIKANSKDIPVDQEWRYRSTRNMEEAEATIADARANKADQEILAKRGGVSTFVARGLAGILDIDTIPSFMLGGVTAGAKTGLMATKSARFMAGGSVGALTAGTAATAGYLADPNADWTVIPTVGLAGFAFGGAGGLLSTPARANASKAKVLDEFGDTINNGHPRANEDLNKEVFENADVYGSRFETDSLAAAQNEAKEAASEAAGTSAPETAVRKPTALSMDELDKLNKDAPGVPDVEVPEGRSSIGARQLGNTGPGVASIRSTRLQNMVRDAKARAGRLGIARTWEEGFFKLSQKAGAIGKSAEYFHRIVTQSPLGSDFGKMMNSGSAVFQNVAYDLLENGAGILRNARSGARLMDHYQKTMLSSFAGFEDAFEEWAGRQGLSFFDRKMNTKHREAFNREVVAEMQARYHNGQGNTQNAAVKKAADHLDETFAKEVDITKGRPGETGVFGTDQLQKRSGYMPQKWSGRNMRRLIEQNGPSYRGRIVDAIAESYRTLHPNMSLKDAKIYADAVVGRAEKFDAGINTNLIGMLQGDGRTELADVLRRNGMSDAEIDKFVDRLTGAMQERGRSGHLKHRLDVDLRHTSSNGVNLMDLVDTDFATLVPKRLRRSAGQAALARKGITSKADWDAIVDAGLEEQIANGKNVASGTTVRDKVGDWVQDDKHINREFMDNLYTYFSGDPIAGGISPMYSRIKKLTNLALLNQLGLTQLAEFGVTMSAVGVESFFRNASEAVVGSLRKVDSPLVQELKHMNVLVPEERLFRDDLVHEFEKSTSVHEWMRGADRIINKASRLQGYTSGFYLMRNLQQRIAVTSAADRLAKHFRDGGLINDDRLFDMGLGNNRDIANLEKYIKNGTVQFDAKGNLQKLNLDKWAPEDSELFALTLNASTNTLVQKAMAGESSMIFHKDGVASLFFHLKSFPMLAMEKQFIRHARMADGEALTAFTYGLGTAAAAYTVRQTINGRTDRLNYEDIARGAIGYSNLTGWLPMWTDPIAGMLGMDSLKVGGYAGMGNQVISTPAAFPTLDRMAQIPGAVIDTATGNMTKSDVNALTATPLIGNAYGFGLLFNTLRNNH